MIMTKLSLHGLALALVVLSSGCALRTASVADLQRSPGRYEDRTVTVNGVVTNSWGLPLVPYKYYRVDDGTGAINVMSQSLRVPGKGERVRVKGRVSSVAVVGGNSFGLYLREQDLSIKRN
jgi:hypothetical protein